MSILRNMEENIFREPSVRISPSFSASFFSSKMSRGDVVLSDLGFSSQLPEFSQSEVNLHNDNWKQDNVSRGRVRFLSHDDGTTNPFSFVRETNENMLHVRGNSVRHSQSGSWLTFTHSEKDLSELEPSDSTHHSRQIWHEEFHHTRLQPMTYAMIVPRKLTKTSQPHIKRSKSMDHCGTSQRRRYLFHQAASFQQIPSSPPACQQTRITANETETPETTQITASSSNFNRNPTMKLFEGRSNTSQIVSGEAIFHGRIPGLESDLLLVELRHPVLERSLLQCTHGGKIYVPFGKISAT